MAVKTKITQDANNSFRPAVLFTYQTASTELEEIVFKELVAQMEAGSGATNVIKHRKNDNADGTTTLEIYTEPAPAP